MSHNNVANRVGRFWLLSFAFGVAMMLPGTCASDVTLPLYPVAEDATPLPLSSYGVFQTLSDAQLSLVQVKLTHVGSRLRSSTAVLFAMNAGQMDITKFRPFWRKHVGYWDEYSQPAEFTVTQAQMRSVLNGVGGLSGVADGGVDAQAVFAFALEGHIGSSDQVFESLLDVNNAKALFVALETALASNPQAQAILAGAACEHDLAQGPAPAEKTSNVQITYSGIRYDRPTGQAVGSISVKNTGATGLSAPVLLVVSSDRANVQPIGPAGITCVITPPRPYFVLPVGSSLAPGATITQVIHFKNPDLEPVRVTARVFAGAGTP